MKLINEAKRMQQLAGILKESQLDEEVEQYTMHKGKEVNLYFLKSPNQQKQLVVIPTKIFSIEKQSNGLLVAILKFENLPQMSAGSNFPSTVTLAYDPKQDAWFMPHGELQNRDVLESYMFMGWDKETTQNLANLAKAYNPESKMDASNIAGNHKLNFYNKTQAAEVK